MTKSEMLLGRLIEERLTPNADGADIDRRIRALFEEEWCVVFTDMAGFSRQSAHDGIIPILCDVHELKRLSRPIIEASGGFVVKTIGDSFLLLFRRAPDGLNCVLQLHRALATYNANRPADRHIDIGAGIGFGKVLKVGDVDVFGVEVNDASRLGEDLAQAGETLVTDAGRAALLHHRGVSFEPLPAASGMAAFRVLVDAPA